MITRVFDVGGNEEMQVEVHLDEPARQLSGEWSCRLVITAGGETLERNIAHGEDSLQAFLLGVRLTEILLQDIQRRHNWHIVWAGSPDLGLHVYGHVAAAGPPGPIRSDGPGQGVRVTSRGF